MSISTFNQEYTRFITYCVDTKRDPFDLSKNLDFFNQYMMLYYFYFYETTMKKKIIKEFRGQSISSICLLDHFKDIDFDHYDDMAIIYYLLDMTDDPRFELDY